MSLRAKSAVAVACLAMLLHAPADGWQPPQSQGAQQHQHDAAKPAGDMSAHCKAMMADHDRMMAEMKAADQRLDELVARMNAASGQAKTDAVAAVVSEIVSQRKTMREGMMKVHSSMMSHMMEHAQAGPTSMAMCPMMKTGGMKH